MIWIPELSGFSPHSAIQLTLWGIVVSGGRINRQDAKNAKELSADYADYTD
jgi:hypothetical protein